MKRGEVWWATLPDPIGSSPGYRRPVLVIQADPFNISAIQTIIVLAITTNLLLSNAPGNVIISKKQSGLSQDSVINISQIITIDKRFLTNQVSILPLKKLQRVEEGLKLVLSL